MTLFSEITDVPLTKDNREPLSRTKVGEPELSSKTASENTFPLSEPGELIPKTDLLTEKLSSEFEFTSSGASMKLRIGTHKNSKQIVIARSFCNGILLDIQA